MQLINWLKACFTGRGKALALCRRGMAKAKAHDEQGAIDDYTSTIKMLGAPLDIVAMALFNRALVFVATGDNSQGTRDLDAVVAMREAPTKIKTMAKQKLIRMKSRTTGNCEETDQQ